jgi:hypothetical protein
MAGDKLKMKHSATLQVRMDLKVNRTQTATLPYCYTLGFMQKNILQIIDIAEFYRNKQ